ncbi:xanthine dehydrogenase family protein molybdopterin-binding subunit [Ramlibacter ginsenosidimutans]|uniref:Xanthine dehydrogenase family protein molybdopterin-binding subunit n=1 Tax=Ramlibacter ginsenosidimutans TaxID=502333 RepID=A0A934TRB3_9BURK|nr:molybdopterin cofactor-binding domain-containing protein [Ramlibacter ginsenosidimutans]MBK6005910.1 xanthine dehydrogenase family protein molybdopterin-binding subunit [Ramlibacter ginsenosidimutans]
MDLELPPALAAQPDPALWLAFETPGRVTVRTGKVELGQGILTALTQLIADGLGVAPAQVDMRSASTHRWPNEGFTVGSLSLEQSGPVMCTLGAVVRWRLMEAAALEFALPIDELTVREGFVCHREQSLGWNYWRHGRQLLLKPVTAADRMAPAQPGGSVGTPLPRVDLRAKLAGGAFIQDLALPGLQHAVALRLPVRGARIANFDAQRFTQRAPQARCIRIGDFLACVAASESAARAAAQVLRSCVQWDSPALPEVGDDAAGWLQRQPAEESVIEPAPADAGEAVELTWTRPFIAHASIGLSCALAWQQGEVLQVWSHSQGIFPLRDAIAQVLQRAPETIHVQHVAGAGCYGHNGADDAALDAALVAVALPGTPVRVQWSREEELREGPLGAPMAVRIRAALDAQGRIASWSTHVRSTSHNMRPGVGGTPNLLAAAAIDPALERQRDLEVPEARGGGATRNARPIYAVGERGLSLALATTHVRTSALRALGAFANVLAIEGMMDELAQRAGSDPAAFRLRHLQDPRAIAVLEHVLAICGWTGPGSAGDPLTRGIGLARYKERGAYCAVVAEVALEETVRVRRFWCAVDAGLVVNPDGARNQVEGGLLQALSWTTLEAVRFEGARPVATGWETYPILRFADVPGITTEFVGAREHPTVGAGETAQGPAAAAIANAVSVAIGQRACDLPLDRARLLQLLA